MKKKICLVVPSLQPGGMERVMSELSQYMCNQSFVEVHLVMYGINPELFYSVPSNLIIHQPDWKFKNSKRIWHTIKRLFYLRKTIKKINPTTVLSFGEYWNSFVLLALFRLKYPLFVSDRCQPDKSLGRLHDFLRNWLYPKATGVIAQTNVAKDIYVKQFNHSNIKVIGNPIRQIVSVSKTIIEKENIVLSIGRLINTKHFDLLIDIFLRIAMPDWKLVIVGGDALKQNNLKKLTEKIKSLNADDKIILTGNISNVEEWYFKSKIFAFTSSSEGFPNVLGEAMSAGMPVIAFDCVAGPADMIDDGANGYLIELFDTFSFENKLKKLMNDESLRIEFGKKARQKISNFSVEVIGKSFYETILNSK